ncbi:MAG: prepilin-type N-terminal cleavage/methylation domain-containing protein [Acinetobacter sp.]
MQNNRGFTLIELIVTIAVLAIIASIAAPQLQKFTVKRQVEKSAVDLEKVFIQARSDAVIYRKKVVVNINTVGSNSVDSKYWSLPSQQTVSFKTGECKVNDAGKKVWGYSSTIPTLTSITFLPQGNVENFPQNLEIKISNDTYNKYVYLTNFGRVTTTNKSNFDGECES